MFVRKSRRGLRYCALASMVLPVSIGWGQSSANVETKVLDGPEGGLEAFEPSIALSPVDKNQVVVGAMYGIDMGRGGRDVWVWRTDDGGRSWSGVRRPAPIVNGKPSNWSPDVVMGFAGDGATLITSMGGSITPRDGGLGGIYVTRQEATATKRFANAVEVMANRRMEPGEKALLHDKPWMIIDHEPRSRYRGSVYVTTGSLDIERLPELRGAKPVTIFESRLVLSASRDGGKTFGPVRTVAEAAFGSSLAVSPDGTLEIAYTGYGANPGLFYKRSMDGGATFSAPVTIAAAVSGVSIGNPTLAIRPNGDLKVCWAQEPSGGTALTAEIVCSLKPAGGAWKPPEKPRLDFPSSVRPGSVRPGSVRPGSVRPDSIRLGSTRPGWPSLVGTARGWHLLLYLTHADRTEVAVFSAAGSTEFARTATLATIPGLSVDKMCITVDCRRYRKDKFAVGDYVGLAASGNRLAAAYILPRPGKGLLGSAAVYVSVWDEIAGEAANAETVGRPLHKKVPTPPRGESTR